MVRNFKRLKLSMTYLTEEETIRARISTLRRDHHQTQLEILNQIQLRTARIIKGAVQATVATAGDIEPCVLP
jgi:hypothetical protein